MTAPSWPLARAGREFIRSTGAVQQRLRGGVADWPGEETFCDIASGLRFQDALGKIQLGDPSIPCVTKCAFRRLYSDGVVARVAVGLKLCGVGQRLPPLGSVDLERILRDLFTVEVRFPRSSGAHSANAQFRPLIDAGAGMRQHLVDVSTSRAAGVKPRATWIADGQPQAVLEVDTGALKELPRHARRIGRANALPWSLSFWRVHCVRPIGIWVLERPPEHASHDDIRRLRIHLSRIHSEREALAAVLRLVEAKMIPVVPKSNQTDALQRYLVQTADKLARPKRDGFSQPELLDIAMASAEFIRPGFNASLMNQLGNIRKSVQKKVDTYARLETERARAATTINNIEEGATLMSTTININGVNVSGDLNVVVAERIENSFNKAAGSSASDEIKKAVEALAVEVAKLATELPPEKAEEVSRDFESLAGEATSDKPRRKWYELSGEGLIEAAKTVAKMATPITTAVKALLSLLPT